MRGGDVSTGSTSVMAHGKCHGFAPAKWYFCQAHTQVCSYWCLTGIWMTCCELGCVEVRVQWALCQSRSTSTILVSRITQDLCLCCPPAQTTHTVQDTVMFWAILLSWTDPFQKLTNPFYGWHVGRFVTNASSWDCGGLANLSRWFTTKSVKHFLHWATVHNILDFLCIWANVRFFKVCLNVKRWKWLLCASS